MPMYARRDEEDKGRVFQSVVLTTPRLLAAKDACEVARTMTERIMWEKMDEKSIGGRQQALAVFDNRGSMQTCLQRVRIGKREVSLSNAD